MCRLATSLKIVGLLVLTTAVAPAQPKNSGGESWRKVGGGTLALGLASPAGGPVTGVWFSADGRTLFARTGLGSVWSTTDGERWLRANGVTQSAARPVLGVKGPDGSAHIAASTLRTGRVYSAGKGAWRSDDGGTTWTNLADWNSQSILGGELFDVAVSPANPDEVVVSGVRGVWRSFDAGQSWAGLNENLPNLPVTRLLAVPDVEPATRILLDDGAEAVWIPGEQAGWRPAPDSLLRAEAALKGSAQAALPGAEITAAFRTNETTYAGAADGRLFVSVDRGATWRESPPVENTGRIRRIYADVRDGRFALALSDTTGTARVLRTVNGGAFWDDITANLPPGAVRGVTADRLTGSVYLATDGGVFQTTTDALAASPATPWTSLREGAAVDVMLDAPGNQLYVATEGAGVYATMAPHRRRDPRVVSAGDRVLRAVAPGSLLSVLGTRIDSAQAGDTRATVLATGPTESQVQLPYDLTGSSVVVSMQSPVGRIQLGMPVAAASPSIFLDDDGNPLLTDADSGLVIDAATPARANGRIQILAAGLGRVEPAWPAGLPAPLSDPPRVVTPVRAWLDRQPVDVLQSTLAPGYIGLYLIELRLPSIVNRGPAELYIEAGGNGSNRVRLWLEP